MSDKRKEVHRVDVLDAISDLEDVLKGNDEAVEKLAMIRQKVDDLSIVVYAASSAGEAIAVVQDTGEGRGVHTLVTDGYKKLVGLENAQLAKTSWIQVVHHDDVEKVRKHYAERIKDPSLSPVCEARIISRTHGTVHTEINIGQGDYNGKPAYVVFLRDISKRKEFERRSRLADKFKFAMEAIRGIGHDLGNMTSSFALLGAHEPEDFDKELWKTVQTSANQTMTLVRKLMEFSGGKLLETVDHVDAADLASNVIYLVRNDYDTRGIDLAYQFEKNCAVYVQPVEFKRALHNLLVNAMEAVEEAEMKKVPGWDGRKEVELKGWKDGENVVITVADTGIGLEDTTKIYLPNFSTKNKGRPSGMGLGMVYSTIVQNSGHIWHSSEGIGKGATCTIKLPYRSVRKT